MSVRPLAALLLAASLAGSCSAARPDETVLVSRVWAELRTSQPFRAADGRLALLAPTDLPLVWHVQDVNEPQVVCGGDMIRRRTYIYRGEPASDEVSPQTLMFDDGSAVQLFAESFIEVVDKCSETVGRWEGIEGTFEGRAGTYRLTDDWLQNKLVLTDLS